ncbi:hypothetical protein [Crenothrix polyspora]|uniref:Uncharacterized protein n=1 Tax=Crenothrix polyspora TaxID=360316 RepID=A0A1R4HHM3_9GAMM|nr:hypothetical protein [Crenothrix polyspora]SJM95521.1 conserved hypothetical protein [Crenothrix polyspora]
MTIQNSEKQKRYRESRIQSGDRHLTCWLDQSDNERLLKLMASLGYGDKGKLQDGYTEVIRLALVQLEKKLNPPRNGLVRFVPQQSV